MIPFPFSHSLLNNRDFVKGLVKLIEPLVRATDKSTGEAVVSGCESRAVSQTTALAVI